MRNNNRLPAFVKSNTSAAIAFLGRLKYVLDDIVADGDCTTNKTHADPFISEITQRKSIDGNVRHTACAATNTNVKCHAHAGGAARCSTIEDRGLPRVSQIRC